MHRRTLLLTGASALVAACASGSEQALEAAPAGPGAEGFAVALYRAVAADGGNQFISPHSVSSAFALLYPGARGQTAAEMAEVFGFEPTPEAEAAQLRELADAMRSDTEGSVLSIADAAWVDAAMGLRPEYAALIRDQLGATIESVDFRSDSAAALDRINAWASSETNGRVPEILTGEDPSRRLVLTNAVYFKGRWSHTYDPAATIDGEFHAEGGGAVPARFMRETTNYVRNLEGDDFQAADFDYVGDQFALSVFLPRRRNGLAAFERALTGAQLQAWLDALEAEEASFLDVTLPKVALTADYELGAQLRALGVAQAFTDAADLSGVTEAPSLKVSAVHHKSFLAVDEEGTEAAAVTAIDIIVTGSRIVRNAPPFTVDHPFFFVLRHRPTGTPLFLGRIATV